MLIEEKLELIKQHKERLAELLENGTENMPMLELVEGFENYVAVHSNCTDLYVELTYAELKTLRDNSELIPGTFYRITDYVTVVNTAWGYLSANHLFDIIVQADSESSLNNNAQAVQHEGETYFENSNLGAWLIKYTLDNDTRYNWIKTDEGKGVIYYMKDEFGNECPYDFKNIMFQRYKITATTTTASSLVNKYHAYWESSISGFTMDATDYLWCYTFSSNSAGGEQSDMSMSKSNNVYNNVIKERIVSNVITINDIVFFGNNCYSNVFGSNCQNNSFGSNSHSNKLGDDFRFNMFGNDSHCNVFGDGCSYNTFGNNSNNNKFGNYCYTNAFGDNCCSNSFGKGCSNNTFGNGCNFGNFDNFCLYNTLGNSCMTNWFGHSNKYNTIGNSCNYNSFKDFCQYNTIGDNCTYNSLKDYCQYNVFGYSSNNNRWNKADLTKQGYFSYVTFEDSVTGVCLTSNNREATSSSKKILNVTIHKGVGAKCGTSISSSNPLVEIQVEKYTQAYEIHYAKTSSGEIRQYTPADVVDTIYLADQLAYEILN